MATTIEGVDFSAQITRLLALETWRNNRGFYGGYALAEPTTPSVQATGAVPPTIRVNVVTGKFVLNGVLSYGAAGTDVLFSSLTYQNVPILAVDDWVKVVFIRGLDAGGVGRRAAIAGPVVPNAQAATRRFATNAEIESVLTAQGWSSLYVFVGGVAVHRTGDLSLFAQVVQPGETGGDPKAAY